MRGLLVPSPARYSAGLRYALPLASGIILIDKILSISWYGLASRCSSEGTAKQFRMNPEIAIGFVKKQLRVLGAPEWTESIVIGGKTFVSCLYINRQSHSVIQHEREKRVLRTLVNPLSSPIY